ncbi:MAG TPA: SRPBCC family protein [Cytophagaceae bacterium]|nr:SRPBCC family protein [Cytophagaceae bacterium]
MKEKEATMLPTNVGEAERMISVLSGSVLLFRALTGKRKPLTALAGAYLLFRGASGHCALYNVLEKKGVDLKPHNITIKTSLTVNRPVEEVYAFWRHLENLPLFMSHLKIVEQLNNKVSEWEAKIPGLPGTISWHAEIVYEEENSRIGWRSLPGSDIENAGTVHFRDGGKFGTLVQVAISYKAPAGKLGERIGKLLNPLFEKVIQQDIKNFKQYLETGVLVK